MKKNILVVLLVMSLLAVSAPLPAEAAYAPATVVLNGQRLNFDVEPVLVDGRWLVPMRAIFEELGTSLEYQAASQKIVATRGSNHIELQIGNTDAYVNGALTPLDVPAQAVDGRTMVPLRFVAEALQAKVNYKKDSNTVTITFKENQDTSTGIYYATMCEGVDESSWSPINETTVFSMQAEKLYSYAVLTQPLTGTMTAKWYFLNGGQREFITEYTVSGEGVNDIFYFWINQSIFKEGAWQCDLLINGTVATTLDFSIVSDTGTYQTIPYWDTWTYEGYVDNGKPSGFGTLTSADSRVTVAGYFEDVNGDLHVTQGGMVFDTKDEVYGDFIFYANGNEHYEGTYYYANGNIFDGVWEIRTDGTSPERGTYYYADGTSKYNDTF